MSVAKLLLFLLLLLLLSAVYCNAGSVECDLQRWPSIQSALDSCHRSPNSSLRVILDDAEYVERLSFPLDIRELLISGRNRSTAVWEDDRHPVAEDYSHVIYGSGHLWRRRYDRASFENIRFDGLSDAFFGPFTPYPMASETILRRCAFTSFAVPPTFLHMTEESELPLFLTEDTFVFDDNNGRYRRLTSSSGPE